MATTFFYGDEDNNYYCEVLFVEGTTARIRMVEKIENDGSTTAVESGWHLHYAATTGGAETGTSAPFTETAADSGIWEAVITGLTRGQTYYYTVHDPDSNNDWGTADGVHPIRGFRACPDMGDSFRGVLIGDPHNAGGIGFGVLRASFKWTSNDGLIWSGSTGQVPHEGCYSTDTYSVVWKTDLYASLVRQLRPDFVIDMGDHIEVQGMCGSLLSSPCDYSGNTSWYDTIKTQYITLMRTYARLASVDKIPAIYSILGNHEGTYDNCPAYVGLTSEVKAAALQSRADILMFPATNGVTGSYGYVDYGQARIIMYDPYSYSLTPMVEPIPFELGSTQAAWLQNAVSDSPHFSFIVGHQQLHGQAGASLGYIYGWGGANYAGGGNNPTQLFNNLTDRTKFLFLGHTHAYCREVYGDSFVYSVPLSGPQNPMELMPIMRNYLIVDRESWPPFYANPPIYGINNGFVARDFDFWAGRPFTVDENNHISTDTPIGDTPGITTPQAWVGVLVLDVTKFSVKTTVVNYLGIPVTEKSQYVASGSETEEVVIGETANVTPSYTYNFPSMRY